MGRPKYLTHKRMDGLVITFSETISNDHHVIGTFNNKPFEMYYETDGASGTIEGDFTDEEKLQILTGWEMQHEVTKKWATVHEYKGYKIEVLHGAGINGAGQYPAPQPIMFGGVVGAGAVFCRTPSAFAEHATLKSKATIK